MVTEWVVERKLNSVSCYEEAKLDNTPIRILNQNSLNHIIAYIIKSYAKDINVIKNIKVARIILIA